MTLPSVMSPFAAFLPVASRQMSLVSVIQGHSCTVWLIKHTGKRVLQSVCVCVWIFSSPHLQHLTLDKNIMHTLTCHIQKCFSRASLNASEALLTSLLSTVPLFFPAPPSSPDFNYVMGSTCLCGFCGLSTGWVELTDYRYVFFILCL